MHYRSAVEKDNGTLYVAMEQTTIEGEGRRGEGRGEREEGREGMKERMGVLKIRLKHKVKDTSEERG